MYFFFFLYINGAIGYTRPDEVKFDVVPFNFFEQFTETTILINQCDLINDNNYNINNGHDLL